MTMALLTRPVLICQRFHLVDKDMENEMVCMDFCRCCEHVTELRNRIEPMILLRAIRRMR